MENSAAISAYTETRSQKMKSWNGNLLDHFMTLGLIAGFVLPFWWALGATLPILPVSWWVAYRSDWF